jgi:ribonuclease HI
MKYYVILKGRQTGIFNNRDECKYQVNGFLWAEYKSFSTKQAAQFAWKEQSFWYKWQFSNNYLRTTMADEFDRAICTDAACPSNPGPIEWRWVDIASGKELFSYGPYEWWSVNIAEFLGILEGLKYLILHYFSWWDDIAKKDILYSDSKIAISRVQQWRANTKITKDNNNTILITMIHEAEKRLHNNRQRSQKITLKKRPTGQWGQITADFWRK